MGSKDSRKCESKDINKDGDSDVRKFENLVKPLMSESILNDCARINKILIAITAKVKKRFNGYAFINVWSTRDNA